MSHVQAIVRRTLRRIGRAVLYGLAAIYFIIDLAFLSFIRPLRHRLLGIGRLHAWIDGLNRYVALSLVLVPLAILEPVKPVAFYLTAKGHVLSGGAVLIFGEIIKVTLVEQVIEITKPKLMSFRWFAWAYGQWEAVMDRLRSIEAWQAIRGQFYTIVARVRGIKAQMETRWPVPPEPLRPGSSSAAASSNGIGGMKVSAGDAVRLVPEPSRRLSARYS